MTNFYKGKKYVFTNNFSNCNFDTYIVVTKYKGEHSAITLYEDGIKYAQTPESIIDLLNRTTEGMYITFTTRTGPLSQPTYENVLYATYESHNIDNLNVFIGSVLLTYKIVDIIEVSTYPQDLEFENGFIDCKYFYIYDSVTYPRALEDKLLSKCHAFAGCEFSEQDLPKAKEFISEDPIFNTKNISICDDSSEYIKNLWNLFNTTATLEQKSVFGSVKGGTFTSKIVTYRGQPYLPYNYSLNEIVDAFYAILEQYAINTEPICVYRTANIYLGPQGLDISDNKIVLPLPTSCTTSLEFAQSWGRGSYKCILVIHVEANQLYYPVEDPEGYLSQHEVTLAPGTFAINEIYESDGTTIIVGTYTTMSLEEQQYYVKNHRLPSKVYYSNINIAFDGKEIDEILPH